MKIAGSNVFMSSDRTYNEINFREDSTGIAFRDGLNGESNKLRGGKDFLDLSSSLGMDSDFTYSNISTSQTERSDVKTKSDYVDDIHNMRMQLLMIILGMFQGMSGRGSGSSFNNVINNLISGMNNGPSMYTYSRSTALYVEEESTSFTAKGVAMTEDGREIGFNVDFAMSRSFARYAQIEVQQEVNLLDPLVVNVGDGVTEITDQSFYFDLDADGKEELVSNIGNGSGFLAYDKNGDGIINDGTELFGALSGNGFKDLAEYDKDHNGWIDENDDIYKSLRIWYRDKNGEDVQMTLKEADVGAIYLGHAATEFTERGSDFEVNGVVRSSGIYLKDSGGVGTIQQVDLAEKDDEKLEISDDMLDMLVM
ncbi:MAG: hypothetical protein K6B41_11290 [Butyrivibrio sp.]|nr:hypothetical protein [Butyrivibrio sp.]